MLNAVLLWRLVLPEPSATLGSCAFLPPASLLGESELFVNK